MCCASRTLVYQLNPHNDTMFQAMIIQLLIAGEEFNVLVNVVNYTTFRHTNV